MIYKRFTEKSAEEWRQIYKALQLMEFLVKNGSERVIDDARSHLSLLKMLRQFHYIDQNGKDQGINVRNRSKELVDLLSDVEKIRAERKKSKATRNKYQGVEGGSGFGIGGSSSRYGGFGGEGDAYGVSFGGSSRAVYGDGGGFGGESHDDYDESGQAGGAERFEEYDEFDDGGAQAVTARRKPEPGQRRASKKATEAAMPKQPEVDLFDFGDESGAPSNGTQASSSAPIPPPSLSAAPAAAAVGEGDEDDFDDFQSAAPSQMPAPQAAPAIPKPDYSSFSTATTTTSTQFAQPTPQSAAQKTNLSNIFSTISPPPSGTTTPALTSAFTAPPPSQAQQANPPGYQPTGPNYFTSVSVQQPASANTPISAAGITSSRAAPAKKSGAGGGDAFASLLSGSKKSSSATQKGMTIADMAKQRSQAGLYGANAPTAMPTSTNGTGVAKPSTGSSGLDDLLG